MHMIATNMCVWLNVLVMETRLDTASAASAEDDSGINELVDVCQRNSSSIMSSLLRSSGPFLFPCTIEYALICSAIIYMMWRSIGDERREGDARLRKTDTEIPINAQANSNEIF